MRVMGNTVKSLLIIRIETQIFLFFCQTFLLGKTHYNFLAVYRRKNRNTDVKFFAVNHFSQTTVLRFTFLGNIQTGNNFNTCNNRCKCVQIVSCHNLQNTIDTIPYANLFFKCFNMNIGRSHTNSFLKHGPYNFYDRCIINGFIFFFLINSTEFICMFRLELFQCFHRLFLTEEFIQMHINLRSTRIERNNLHTGNKLYVINSTQVHRVRHGNFQSIIIVLIITQRKKIISNFHHILKAINHLYEEYPHRLIQSTEDPV